ncbi:MAG TPA: SpoIID/LytB domain-containing protein [Gemmatimonadaceae bacterium]|nr:SpoIID/LytB domain-containing protein [Gemmatimonadaceae bacterium]
MTSFRLPNVVLCVAAAYAIIGCSDRTVTAPRAIPVASYDDVGLDAGPDSGEAIAVSTDGPADGGRVLRLAAVAAMPTIRVGVVQSASSLALGSKQDYVVTDKANGLEIVRGSGDAVTITLDQAPKSFYRLQVMCASVTTVGQRKAAADAAGYKTLTEFVPTANCTRLYIGEFAPPPANTFAARTAFRNELITEGLAGTDSFWKVLALGNALYRVTHGTTTVQSIDPIVVSSPTGFVTFNDTTYRGKAEARVNSSGTLAGINELPLEQYLYGVVPRELGPVAFPLLEAQKAQAVAARTYAIANIGRRASDGYDLRATTDDQVYGGYTAEYPLSNRAVDETAGIVATYGGKPIDALYSSTSGGHTADNEESFSGTPVPYLRGVPDAERGEAFDHVPSLSVFMSHANPISLRAQREGDAESDWSRYHRWTFDWTLAELSAVLSASAGQPVGTVSAINVLSRGPSGRVLSIAFVTDVGTFTVEKGAIRTFLKYLDAAGKQTALPSTLFYLEPIVDRASQAVTGYRIYGGGFGHGVGLSQTGAVGLAQQGQDFARILAHYYQGIDLTRQY